MKKAPIANFEEAAADAIDNLLGLATAEMAVTSALLAAALTKHPDLVPLVRQHLMEQAETQRRAIAAEDPGVHRSFEWRIQGVHSSLDLLQPR